MSIENFSIKGEALSLAEIFSDNYEYHIPDYQRPYSWDKTQIIQLFDDLYSSYKHNSDELYFLGSIVIVKQDKIPKSYVVDGQQRLTSLTILISVLISYFSNETDKEDAKEYLMQKGKRFQKIEAKPRLTLREKDKDFFRKYIQETKLDELISLDKENGCKNDSQRNIYKNTYALLTHTKDFFGKNEENIHSFLTFLITQCCLVVVSTSTSQSAFRIFSVMNNRGLDLLPSDILKAEMIGKIKQNQEKYTEKWENLEDMLGRENFNELFSHIRMIELTKKASNSILEEIQKEILPEIKSIEEFIDKKLTDYAEALNDIKNNSYRVEKYEDKINQYFFWLNNVGFSEWIPVAILFLYQKPNNDAALEFFKKLDILTSFLYLSAKDVNKRIERYGEIIKELKNTNQSSASLLLTPEEKSAFKTLLNGNIYEDMIAARRNYLILRLDEMISGDGAKYSRKKGALTIEHILPQKINEGSQWSEWWTNEEHTEWLHRLANLIPLSRQRNSSASNSDFKDKKDKYFSGNRGVTPYTLAINIQMYEEWKPKDVQTRQEQLLNRIYENWDLK